MSRFLSLLVLLMATCLLAVGPAARMIAAESNRFAAAEFPKINPPTPSSAPAAAPLRAETPPVVAPAPVALETKAAKPGIIARIIAAIRSLFTFNRRSNTAVETPPVVQSPTQVVAEKTGAPSAEANATVEPTPTPTPEAAPAAAPASASVLAAKPESAPTPTPTSAPTPTPASTSAPTPAAARAPASVLAAKPAAKSPVETPQVESAAAVSFRRFNWLERNWGPAASVPALVAGALPSLRAEARRSRAPNLSRQMRLDMDQRIERLGPELEPVSGFDTIRGASLSSAPVVAGVEETVLTLEAAALVQAKAAGGVGVGGMAGKITRRSEEIKLIPNEAKQRERFREVSVFFDLPPPQSSKPAETPKSSATYETK